MKKLRSNSNWNQLSREQQVTAEKWLFEEHLGYDEVAARIQAEFAVETSRTSVGRYYRRRAQERQITDLVETQAMADALAEPDATTDSMRSAAIKLIAKLTLQRACERPEQVRDLEAMTRLLLLSEDNDIRRSRLRLEVEQFRYEATKAASEELPRLAGLLASIQEDEDLSPEEKVQKVQALLFPDEAPHDSHPDGETDPNEED